MQTRLAALESEVQRLRALNEKISLSVGGTPEANVGLGTDLTIHGHNIERPLSPPPESNSQPLAHSITAMIPLEESSGSASEPGF